MDTLRKIQSLRADPEPDESTPRATAMSYIHGLLNQAPSQDLTVGHAVAAAIEGIRFGAGEHGARDVHTVFMDPDLTSAYLTPLGSADAPAAHERIASAEYAYWHEQNRQNPSVATEAALSFSVADRVQLQSRIGRLVQMGSSFTQNLEGEQTFSTGNLVASHVNAHLPSGSAQPGASRSAQNSSARTTPAASAPAAPPARRR
ncbi:hypothetical protein ACGFS9_19740 [Streptomyces sp. NPDC048566]|uniref:hypothetical protein n=1 Tax=Streptomyces sp. NPDC048566 TaxID=3365569 RepID=UPI00371C82BD